MLKKGYIYLIRDLVNGKGYVGKTERTIGLRFSQPLRLLAMATILR